MSRDGFDDFDEDLRPGGRSLRLSDLLATGVDDLASISGAQLVLTLSVLTFGLNALSAGRVREQLLQVQSQGVEIPSNVVPPAIFAVDFPTGVPLIAGLALRFVIEVVKIVGVRTFAAAEHDGINLDTATRDLARTSVVGFVGGGLLTIGLLLGAVALVVPAVVVYVLTIFYRQEIALADKGLFNGISDAVALTKGHRWQILGLAAVFGAFTVSVLVVQVVVILSTTWLVGTVIGVVLKSLVVVLSIGMVTAAWQRLDRHRETTGGGPDDWEQDDDEWVQNDSGAEWS